MGTGPIGIAFPLEAERRGCALLVLEAGDTEVKPIEASRAEIVDPLRHASMDLTFCGAPGGTSWTWGGRCVPYEAVDWIDRDFVAEARWPIRREEVTCYNQRATHILHCGDQFDIPDLSTLWGGLSLDPVERWLACSQLTLYYRERFLKQERISSASTPRSPESTLAAMGNESTTSR